MEGFRESLCSGTIASSTWRRQKGGPTSSGRFTSTARPDCLPSGGACDLQQMPWSYHPAQVGQDRFLTHSTSNGVPYLLLWRPVEQPLGLGDRRPLRLVDPRRQQPDHGRSPRAAEITAIAATAKPWTTGATTTRTMSTACATCDHGSVSSPAITSTVLRSASSTSTSGRPSCLPTASSRATPPDGPALMRPVAGLRPRFLLSCYLILLECCVTISLRTSPARPTRQPRARLSPYLMIVASDQ